MGDGGSLDLLKLFKLESDISDAQIQVAAVKRLPRIAYALGEEATRDELIPYLKEYLNKIYCFDEVQLHFAIALAGLFPYLGGTQHVELLFDLFDVLATTDEEKVREAAVESLRTISEQLDDDTLQGPFIEFIMMLLEKDWFAPKSSAIGLFSTCYPRVPEEIKNRMREQYLKLYDDESPMVRKFSAVYLNSFSNVLEEQYVETVSLGLYLQFSSDDQDSIRTHCVDLTVTLSRLLSEDLIRDHVMDVIRNLAGDTSWKVRLELARKIDDIQTAIGADLTRQHLLEVVRNLSEDDEQLVREALAENLVQFAENLQETFVDGGNLDPTIETKLLPLVKRLTHDSSEVVKAKMSSVLMDLTKILDQERVKKYLLPLIVETFETDRKSFDETLISNLNKLILTIGLSEIDDQVKSVMFKILAMPDTNWRTRRNLILTIKIILARSEEDHFTKNAVPFYHKLLTDHVFSIRKTSPIILPLMIKKFGMTWAKSHLLNNIFCLTGHPNYLHRFIVLFCIDEIVEPTLQADAKAHLSHIHNPQELYKIYYLKELLDMLLYESWVEDLTKDYDCELSDDIILYAENSLEELQSENVDVYGINEHGEDYLEATLYLVIRYVLDIVKQLSADKVDNVKYRSAHTVKKILRLKRFLEEDFKEVGEVLDSIPEDVREICRLEVHAELSKEEPFMETQNIHRDRSIAFRKKIVNSHEDVTDLDEVEEVISFSEEVRAAIEKIEEVAHENQDRDGDDSMGEDSVLV